MQFIPLNLNASWQDKIGIPQRKRLRHDTNLIFSLPAADFSPPVFPFFRFPEAPVFFAQSTQKQKSDTLSA